MLTLGASVLGLIKSAKEKKAKGTRPEVLQPKEFPAESDNDTVIITQQAEIFQPEEMFQPVCHDEGLAEKLSDEQPHVQDNHVEFDIRQAIIASEILNRKY